MAVGKLTKSAIDELKPGSRDYFLWDVEFKGFGVKVTTNGARSYVYQYRMGGRGAPTRRYSIGTHGSPWMPATARKEAERIAIQVAQGIDPMERQREARRVSVDLAFRAYSQHFLASCDDGGWKRLVERTLRLHTVPYLKDKPLPDIKRSDIVAILDKLPHERVALKRNTFAVLRRLFRWAVSRDDIKRSPCEGMETPPAVMARDRVLSDQELAIVWLASLESGRLFGPIVRLLIATGKRREEVTQMDWSEVDRASASWAIPKERSKNRISDTVPLNAMALSVLDAMVGGEKWPPSGPLFSTTGKGPFTAHAKGKTRLDRIATKLNRRALAPWRLHDLRRTMATNFQRLGIRFEVTEAALNHVGLSRYGVAGIYQRHDWQEEKKAAYMAWSEHLEQIIAAQEHTAFATSGAKH